MSRSMIIGALDFNALADPPHPGDRIIAADKGYLRCIAHGITPDLVIGDFDSLGYEPEGVETVRLHVRKDDTDIGHAVELELERGCRAFAVYGAVGGKLDHTLANIQIASMIAQRGGVAVFYGDSESFAVIPGGSALQFGQQDSGRVSVFSLSDRCEGVTLGGLSYTLENGTLSRHFPLGVSNAFIGERAHISLLSGELLVVFEGHEPPIFSKL